MSYTTLENTQAAAVLSGSVLSGTMLAFSFITVPVILKTTRDGAQLYTHWLNIYNAGFPILPTISIATCATWLFLAISKGLNDGPWVGCAAAGLTTVLMVPFTWVVLVPTNNYLMQLEKDAKAGKPADIEDAKKLVKFWSGRHLMRSLFPLLGAAIGLRELLIHA